MTATPFLLTTVQNMVRTSLATATYNLAATNIQTGSQSLTI